MPLHDMKVKVTLDIRKLLKIAGDFWKLTEEETVLDMIQIYESVLSKLSFLFLEEIEIGMWEIISITASHWTFAD